MPPNPYDDPNLGATVRAPNPYDDPRLAVKPAEGGWRRMVGMGALGFNDSVADTLGAPADLAALGLRQLGVPANKPIGGSETFRGVFDYAATAPGRVRDFLQQGSFDPLTESRTARDVPRDSSERLAYGAGRGAGGAASLFVPAAAVARAAAPNTVKQGIADILAAQPAAQTIAGATGGAVTEETGNPYYGAAAGIGTLAPLAAGRRAITPGMQLSEENQRIAEVLRNHGVPMSAGQASGSGPWRTMESVLGNHPITARIAGSDARNQREAFNRAVTGYTGQATESITPQYLADTKSRLGQGFNDIAARNSVNLDDQFLRDVRGTTGQYGDTLDILRKPIFDRLAARMTGEDKPMLDQAISAITGRQMTGEEYQALRSKLGMMADSAMNADPQYGRALAGLQKSLDDAMTRSAGPGDAAQWKQLRGEYGAYKTIEDTMRATNATGGDIPPTQLWMQARDRNNPALQDLARGGQQFVKDTIPNSGTPQRMMAQTLMTGGALGAGGLAGGWGALEPFTASAVFGLPVAAQAVMRGGAGRMRSAFPSEGLIADQLAQRLLLESQQGGQRLGR